jgi:hypothetical protein
MKAHVVQTTHQTNELEHPLHQTQRSFTMKTKTLALLVTGTIVFGVGAAIAIATPASMKHNSITSFFDDIVPTQPENTSDSSSDTAQAAVSQPDLVTGQVIIQESTPNDTTPLTVQWNAANSGQGTSQGFKDKLQIFFVGKESNACPGSIPPAGEPVYESERFQEDPLPPNQVGQLMVANISPLPEGSYIFYVTANSDRGEPNESNFDNNSNSNCIYINHS